MGDSGSLNFSWIESNRNLTFMEFIKTSGDSFSDVTLVSGDLQEFPAHKLVLSASSSFFQQVLLSRQQQQQERLVLFLSNVYSKDLSNILDFVYQGTLNVQVDEVDQFMSTGNLLNIKGIVNTKEAELTLTEEKPKKRRARKRKVTKKKDADLELQNDETGSEVIIEIEENDKIQSNQEDLRQSEENFNVDQETIAVEKEQKTVRDEEITVDEEASSYTTSQLGEDLKNYSKDQILNAYNKMKALKKLKSKEKNWR